MNSFIWLSILAANQIVISDLRILAQRTEVISFFGEVIVLFSETWLNIMIQTKVLKPLLVCMYAHNR